MKSGRGDEFIMLFDTFDYSDVNPFHNSNAQVKDGILCRDVVHAEIRKLLAEVIKPEFVHLIEGGHFAPTYAAIVSSTPQAVLDRAAR